MATIISLLVSTKQYNKTRRYHLSTFQVSCNYLVYFLRSNQLYTCINIFYLQDFNTFDGATKTTTTKLPQHSFSYPYKTIFPRLRMVIVHNPIQNKWLSKLSYLSEQICVSNMEKWHEHALCGHFDQQKSCFREFLIWSNFKHSCSFSCIHMFVLPENRRLCN